MSTEIGPLPSSLTQSVKKRDLVTRDAPGTQATPPGEVRTKGQGGNDAVILSDSAVHLIATQRRLAEQSEVDMARVAAIREALQNGTYQPDAVRITDAILAQERLFLGGGDQS
ncbi:flagellar biosynthesis anti-sigma factor FlgM [Thioalkalicoccus limnaeus]|uniref:Negative regulator of flagellin synthesis n=1 Tax=Thioalkalicoccus limnaeus TaxID=120681 RepID=A0ABV4BBR8_9GAMM